MSDAVFALLDDASDLTSSERRSRRYTQCTGALHLHPGDDCHRFFTELQQALDAGLHTVTLAIRDLEVLPTAIAIGH